MSDMSPLLGAKWKCRQTRLTSAFDPQQTSPTKVEGADTSSFVNMIGFNYGPLANIIIYRERGAQPLGSQPREKIYPGADWWRRKIVKKRSRRRPEAAHGRGRRPGLAET